MYPLPFVYTCSMDACLEKLPRVIGVPELLIATHISASVIDISQYASPFSVSHDMSSKQSVKVILHSKLPIVLNMWTKCYWNTTTLVVLARVPWPYLGLSKIKLRLCCHVSSLLSVPSLDLTMQLSCLALKDLSRANFAIGQHVSCNVLSKRIF